MKTADRMATDRIGQSRGVLRWGRLALLLVWAVVAAGTYVGHPGSPWVLTAFHLAFAAMLALLPRRPRVDAYSFLAIFLFLGFWAKFVAHQWFRYPYIEPVGDFAQRPEQWDRALAAATAAAVGVALFRVAQLGWLRHRAGKTVLPASMPNMDVPAWYRHAPGWTWAGLTAAVLLFYLANYHYAFFVTGVNARVVLPFKLNAIFAWTAYCGIAMLVMLLADWEQQRRPDRLGPLVIALSALGVLMSASMSSRASALFVFGALAMACLAHRRIAPSRWWRNGGWKWLPVMAAAFAASLVAVSAIRLTLYKVVDPNAPAAAAVPPAQVSNDARALPPPGVPADPVAAPQADAPTVSPVAPPSAPAESATAASPDEATPTVTVAPVVQQRLQMTPSNMLRQVMLLTIDRWIGMEGMLAMASSDRLGTPLLREGLTEDPARGVNAVFQRIAHSVYVYQPDFTYLTLPGFAVVLYYGGSLLVVCLGMFVVCALICWLDGLALRATGSRLLTAWVGLLLANAVCQMSFPYLALVFAVLTALSLVGFRLLGRIGRGGPQTVAQHA
jgi:hypothetical protein